MRDVKRWCREYVQTTFPKLSVQLQEDIAAALLDIRWRTVNEVEHWINGAAEVTMGRDGRLYKNDRAYVVTQVRKFKEVTWAD